MLFRTHITVSVELIAVSREARNTQGDPDTPE